MDDQRTVKAMRVVFQVDKVFPSDDPLSIPLLRLMIAVDDVRHLQKLLIRISDDVNEHNMTERAILEGEQGHLFRLLCGHLYEAGNAFHILDDNKKTSDRLDAAVVIDDQAKKALEFVRQAYRRPDPHDKDDNGGFSYSFLYHMRHYIGFHYKGDKLRAAFEKYKNSEVFQGSLALVEHAGLSRYTVTDNLVKLVMADVIGDDIATYLKKFPESMRTAIVLAGSLAEIVDHLLRYMIEQNPSAILEEHEDLITIPASVQRLKEQVDWERRTQP